LNNAANYFTNSVTQDITRARQEHLASLGLDLSNKRVLEVGAGVGLHTPFFISRGCEVVVTDGNIQNVAEIKNRLPDNQSLVLDLEQDQSLIHLGQFDLVYSYGLFYHLGNLEAAIRNLAEICTGQILIETRVSVKTDDSIDLMRDHGGNNGSIYGQASRPSRQWMLNRLNQYFGYGYISATQPAHGDFPRDWNRASGTNNRAIFVGSKTQLDLGTLITVPIDQQQVYRG
jgi:SAM-dependent methyltransferase